MGRSRSRILRAAAALLMAATALSGCIGSDDADDRNPTDGDSGADTRDADGSDRGTTRTILMEDNRFRPDRPVLSGRRSVTLRNRGRVRHNFSIPAIGVSVDVRPRSSAGVLLPPGRRRFVCRFHRREGMTGIAVIRKP